MRGEVAYLSWTSVPESDRPLAKGCADAARMLDRHVHAAWLDRDDRASNACIANHLGVDEKIVRDYRKNVKRWPVGALLAMPSWLQRRIVPEIVGATRVSENGVEKLHDGLAALETRTAMSSDERASLLQASIRIAQLLARGGV